MEARLIDQTATVNRAVAEERQRCLDAVERIIMGWIYLPERHALLNALRREIEAGE